MPPAVVSVAIPTYNRAASLLRTVESVLTQTHEDLEVVISDNASTDGTGELIAELERRDRRVRSVRHPVNAGMVANLDASLRAASGDNVMLLSDDDRLAPGCVQATLAELRVAPGRSAALGRVAYVRDGTQVEAGQPVSLIDTDPRRRVRDYFAAVGGDHGNTWIYGLVPRAVMERLPPLRNVLGFDWLRVAELAYLGPIAMVGETLLYRELGGVSDTTERNVRESLLPSLHAKVPHLVIAREVLADVGWRSPVYAGLSRRQRLALAVACAGGVPARNLPHVLFHLAPGSVQRRWRTRQ